MNTKSQIDRLAGIAADPRARLDKGHNGIRVLPQDDRRHTILAMWIKDHDAAWVEYNSQQLSNLIGELQAALDDMLN